MSLTHGSLFSGIGGFDLAAELAGWENMFHCELNPFGRRVLHHYWPNATCYEDITKADFSIWRGRIDVLTGGFPCQPYSMAGKRLGKEDERHLWPAMLAAIRSISPRWVVGENVLGLVSWNGGLVFEEVQADLEAEGYSVQPYVLPACSVNAPHRRDRTWFVTYAAGKGRKEREQDRGRKDSTENGAGMEFWDQRPCSDGHVAYSGCGKRKDRLHGQESPRKADQFGDIHTQLRRFDQFPTTQPTICRGDDGLPMQLDGISFSRWRNESIKAYGNAIVPQVALQIFQAINQYEAINR